MVSVEESIVYLIIRITIGVIFVYHGLKKMFDLENWNKFIVSKDLPIFMGPISALFETVIGFALIAGLLTRLSALGLIIFMIIAILLAHANDKISNITYQISIILLGLTVALTGAGKFSLDAFLEI